MNKKGISAQIAANMNLPAETVESVLDNFEEIAIRILERGDQLHWGGFLRAWTVLKRPINPSGEPLYNDTPKSSIRYRSPCCTFGAKMVQRMKHTCYNIADKNWEKKEPLPKKETPKKKKRKITYMEIT